MKKIEFDAPASSRKTRAWVVGTADTQRSYKWLDLEVRVILQLGDYQVERQWQDSLFEAYENGQRIEMPAAFVKRAFTHIQEANKRLLDSQPESGQMIVWPAMADKFTKMSESELQAYCDQWLTSQIGRYYDLQMLGCAFLENPNPTYGEFGPNEIHPNAVAVPNGLKIQDVRIGSHPWGRGRASQW